MYQQLKEQEAAAVKATPPELQDAGTVSNQEGDTVPQDETQNHGLL